MSRVSVYLILAGFLSGCGGPSPQATPSSDPPAGLSVSLAQWRSDEPVHGMQVAVRNTSGTPVYFADVQLVTPSFETLPAQKADTTIQRTDRTDLPIPYGKAVCSPEGLPEVRPATVVAHLRTGSEQALRRVVFKVPHPDPLLARLVRDECSEYLIKQAADISFGPGWRREGEAMRGTLTLTRRGPGTVAVHSIGGTTHYIAAPVGKANPLVELGAQASRAEAPIELTPGRCDPHAFAEAKKAFQFPVRASVDGGVERVVIVAPPKPVQDRLIDYALDACGLGG
ncbi:hypothetical protein [Nonomuraea sp. LPB2021202275-12-8]|uniref:hypothetical protein n=1 Tax=Nonomuraea sp. LPB2021202275-12-8 TaxID=3120159 RepID=UPI00300D10F1